MLLADARRCAAARSVFPRLAPGTPSRPAAAALTALGGVTAAEERGAEHTCALRAHFVRLPQDELQGVAGTPARRLGDRCVTGAPGLQLWAAGLPACMWVLTFLYKYKECIFVPIFFCSGLYLRGSVWCGGFQCCVK